MNRLIWILTVLLCWQPQVFAALPSGGEKGDAAVQQVLEELEGRMGRVETMQSRFTQKKRLRMFQHEIELRGSVHMQKPGRFAWHTRSPVRHSMVLEDGKIYQWSEDTNRTEVFSFSDAPVLRMVIEQMQTWFNGEYAGLMDQYDIRVAAAEPLELEFIPQDDALSAGMIQSIRIRFRGDRSYIESIDIEERNGDRSVLLFTDTVLNAGIDPSVWKVKSRAS